MTWNGAQSYRFARKMIPLINLDEASFHYNPGIPRRDINKLYSGQLHYPGGKINVDVRKGGDGLARPDRLPKLFSQAEKLISFALAGECGRHF